MKRGKQMTNFDEYVSGIEKRRTEERQEKLNEILQWRLRECSHEETVKALYAALGLYTKELIVR